MITQQTQHEHHHTALLEGLRAHLQPLTGDARQYDGLLCRIGRAQLRLRVASRQLHRAIGVSYQPDTERQSYYFKTRAAASRRGAGASCVRVAASIFPNASVG